MTLRDERQLEFANTWLEKRIGILNLCPRFGKCRVAINIIKELKPSSILIAFPDNKIRKSWEDEFEECDIVIDNITFTNYRSIGKYVDTKFDLIILDEIHTLSEAQLQACGELFMLNQTNILGLTGTLSHLTAMRLEDMLRLSVLVSYSIEQAIEEGVISDYEIHIVEVALDDKKLQTFGKKQKTEKKYYDGVSWVISEMEKKGKDPFFLRMTRMRIIQNSIAKQAKTISLLQEFKDERILVFCGLTKIADSLGIDSYHANSVNTEKFDKFVRGEGKHLAVCKLGNTGVTYMPLNKIIINFFDSNEENLAQKVNRCMSIEYANPEKKAIIYIVTSNEPIEKNWLRHALKFFDKNKIIWENKK